jgi:hypothetical protein
MSVVNSLANGFILGIILGRHALKLTGVMLIIATAVGFDLIFVSRWPQNAALLTISICSIAFAHRWSIFVHWREGMRCAGYLFGLLALGRLGFESWQSALPVAAVAAGLVAITQLGRWLEAGKLAES